MKGLARHGYAIDTPFITEPSEARSDYTKRFGIKARFDSRQLHKTFPEVLEVKAIYLERGFYKSTCLTLLYAYNYAYVVPIIKRGRNNPRRFQQRVEP